MIHFKCFTRIIITILLLDYSSVITAVRDYHTHLDHSRYKRNTLEPFDCGRQIEISGIDLINYGITLIYQNVENKTIEINNNFTLTLHNLYNLSGTEHGVRKLVTTYLNKYNKYIKKKDFENYTSFYQACIHFYTTFYAYKEINACLRAHKCNRKELTQKEQYLAPYSAVLMSILLYWDDLEEENGTTYRGANLTQNEIEEFTEALDFTWPSFTSSSRIPAGASQKDFTCKFEFENSEETPWRAKRIAKYAYNPQQEESLYPPGVQFQVLSKLKYDNGTTTIKLKLISSKTNSNTENKNKTDENGSSLDEKEQPDKVTAPCNWACPKCIVILLLISFAGGVLPFVLAVKFKRMLTSLRKAFLMQSIINIIIWLISLIIVYKLFDGFKWTGWEMMEVVVSSFLSHLVATIFYTAIFWMCCRFVHNIDIEEQMSLLDIIRSQHQR